MNKTYYIFAAKGIQEFILAGDRLNLMIGGSHLVENISGSFLDNVITGAGISDYKVLSRAAGGAKIIFNSREDAEKLAERMPMLISAYAPGLEVIQYFCGIEKGLVETMNTAESKMAQRRNIVFPSLPCAQPPVKRAPRSGRSAVKKDDEDVFDEAMKVKMDAVKNTMGAISKKIGVNENIFERDMDKIAGENKSYVAVIHADGNSLGVKINEMLNQIQNENIETAGEDYRKFSEKIENASVAAMKKVIEIEGIRLRPLVLAGDDATFIVSPEHAIAATDVFLRTFSQESGFTACAGIAFVKKNFPFHSAYELSESLCAYSKNKFERKKSGLAYFRVTTSAVEDFETILKNELTAKDKDIELTAMPYEFGDKITELVELKEQIKKVPKGALRGLVTAIYDNHTEAMESYRRIQQVANGKKYEKEFKKFEEKLKKFGDPEKEFVPALRDAMELISVEGKGNNDESKN